MSRSLLLYALIALGCVLGLLLVFGIVLAFAWPWWVGIFLVILLLGVGIAAVIVRKVVLRRKEQLFVAQIIEQDNAYVKSMKDDEKKNLADIQDKWKEAVGALKKSHLKKFGNPLYVLPWYMVIGESGAGKTTSIKSARLSSPFAEYTKVSGFSGTKNCDWWFFEQAIIIDTAGRYAIPVDEGRDKDEWQKFVALLAKYRKREPLNGLVVAVATDKLLQSRPELIEEDGRNIRRRIDELMRGLGSRFPIYVLVTKCDSRLVEAWFDPEQEQKVRLTVAGLWFTPGRYTIDVFLCRVGILDAWEAAASFEVLPELPYPEAMNDEAIQGFSLAPDGKSI
ncbi:MAG TPA: type VI secretion protein IcmF/TssM N-terminal domain-containing protein, partial [Deltaproteobacteria bacterium]|nr:type VI secretion protein IcmF/TssM N-terminal domain-containing protein [Deltaproteobacteria bacterium]